MPNIRDLAPGLTRDDSGLWLAPSRKAISYPEKGNQACFAVEDVSFWFHHRNQCLVEALRRYPPAGFLLDVGAGNGFVSAGI